MIRSMTGFGVASADAEGGSFSVEVRSVNNKFFKATMRVPDALGALEADLESQLGKRISRGSVMVTVRVAESAADRVGRIDGAALEAYMAQLRAVLPQEQAARLDPSALLDLPGVVITVGAQDRADRARGVLTKLLDQACDRLLAMRATEGQALAATLADLGVTIRERLAEIAERSPQVVQAYQERLRTRMATLLADAGASVREEDIIREVAVFAERSDIAEEVNRLGGHLDQFARLISPQHAEPAGRTLDFLAQEMLREANTIASKSSDVEISRRIVEIKACIDRIKEQAQNAE